MTFNSSVSGPLFYSDADGKPHIYVCIYLRDCSNCEWEYIHMCKFGVRCAHCHLKHNICDLRPTETLVRGATIYAPAAVIWHTA